MENEIITQLAGTGAMWPIEITPLLDINGNPVYKTLPDGTQEPQFGWYPETSLELVKQSISTIIDTQVGFMIRNEGLGTRLAETFEEPNSQVNAFLVRKYITDAITTFEPRAEIQSITTTIDTYRLKLEIIFSLKSMTEITDTLVQDYTI